MIRHEMGIVRLPVILLILYGTRNHIHTFRHFPVGIENADELKSLAMASAIDATSKASVQLAMDVIENGATASAHSKARGFAPLGLTKTIQSAPVPTHDVGSNVATRFTRWRWLSGSPPKAGVLTDFIEIFATLFQVSDDHFGQRWESGGDQKMGGEREGAAFPGYGAWGCWWKMLDTTRLSKGWAYDEQLFHACGGATWKKHKSTSRKRAKDRQLRGNASFSSLPSPQSGRSIRMGVIPGMTAEHDTAGYYDSKGYCSVLERYADTRDLAPGAQYTAWHKEAAMRGEYDSGRIVPPAKFCCSGELRGGFG